MSELLESHRPITVTDQQAVSNLKLPPQSLEAEQAVLGGVMLDGTAWDEVADQLQASDFYRHEHQKIFTAIGRLANRSIPLDVVTISEELERHDELKGAGGLAYLGEIAAKTPSAANIHAYAAIVRDRSVRRKLVTVSGEISSTAFSTEGRTTAELLDEAESKVLAIAESHSRDGGPQGVNPLLTATLERIEELFNSKSTITGLTTGFRELDSLTAGFQPGDLIIVAGRPSMGKTSFAMNLVENALMLAGKPVLVFSLEMPAESLIMRMFSSLGRIDQSKIRTGRLSDDDWPRLTSAVSMLKDKHLYIDDTQGLSPNEMRSRARRIKRDQGEIGLIMIDYLQLMSIPGTSENRTGEISEISRSLKGLAKEMGCPVVALSQLNRRLEERPNKRPVNSDLRESGAIEQDADVIAFIYRDEVYNEDSNDKGIAEVIISKQRNGPIGNVKLAFLGKYTRFEDLAHEYMGEDTS